MMRLSEIATALGAPYAGPDAEVSGVSTDSRSIAAGELFVALSGERFNGHDYVVDVLARGAAGALVNADFAATHPQLPLIGTGDTRLGLGRLATWWRGRFAIPLVAVTGSNGKTTVKEMIAAIFQAEFGPDAVLATRGNLNNEIGVPLTLLALRPGHRAAVIEMGMNHPGEIDYLSKLAQPTVALVNNAQRAHLAGLGSVEDVARAKGEIFGGLAAQGVAVVNADDPHADLWRKLAERAGRVVDFALETGAEVRGRWTPQGFGGRLELSTPAGLLGVAGIQLGVPGRHNACNACAAAAAALAAGVAPDAVVAGLTSYGGVKGRLQRRPGLGGALVIDDSYNANPDSMRAAIDVLAAVPGRRLFVMGDMGEAGDGAAQLHDEIGGYAKSQGIDGLFALGDLSVAAAANFGTGGAHYARPEELLKALVPQLDPRTTVLVKGSRFMKMERVADAITENDHAAETPQGGANRQPERARPAIVRHPVPQEGGRGEGA